MAIDDAAEIGLASFLGDWGFGVDMNRARSGWWAMLAAGVLLAGCGDDGGGEDAGPEDAGTDTGTDGGMDAGMDAGPEDGGMDAGDDAGVDPVARGEYLVHHVLDCIGCHTPRGGDGAIMTDMYLAGNPTFIDADPTDDTFGLLPTPNLTPAGPLGEDGYTDEALRSAITEGHRPASVADTAEEEVLIAIMPYWYFANVRDEDMDAVIAYLRSLEPIENDIPKPQAPFTEPPFRGSSPVTPVPPDMIPETTLTPDAGVAYERAQEGRYLAGMAAPCMDCHTVWDMEQLGGGSHPLVLDNAFAGGRDFPMDPTGPFPNPVFSSNITPNENGIQGWTIMQVQAALQEGTDDDGDGLCPPMPVAPGEAFLGISDEDAIAIGTYLTTLEPKPIPEGTYSPDPPPDGGVDAGPDGGDPTVYNYDCVPP